jgi:hypothetical protein
VSTLTLQIARLKSTFHFTNSRNSDVCLLPAVIQQKAAQAKRHGIINLAERQVKPETLRPASVISLAKKDT